MSLTKLPVTIALVIASVHRSNQEARPRGVEAGVILVSSRPLFLITSYKLNVGRDGGSRTFRGACNREERGFHKIPVHLFTCTLLSSAARSVPVNYALPL